MNHKPDIILADLLMPKMGGLELIKKIRESNCNTPVLIITSVGDVETILEAVGLGIDGYIIKPINFNELEVKIYKIADEIKRERAGIQGGLESVENRGEIEDAIKKCLAATLKDYTGKGFREAIVQLIGQKVRITVFGAFTTLETHLASDRKNEELIRHIRMLVYEAIKPNLEKSIQGQLDKSLELTSVNINVKKKMETLEFS